MDKALIVDLTNQLATLAQIEVCLEKLKPIEGTLTEQDIYRKSG